MGRIAGWLGVLCLGTLYGASYDGGVTGTLIAGLLVSLASGALCEWMLPAPASMPGNALAALLATFIPDWLVFLPALAFMSGVGLGAIWPSIKISAGYYDNYGSMGTYPVKAASHLRRKTAESTWPGQGFVLLLAFSWPIPAIANLLQLNGYRKRYTLLVALGSVLIQYAGLACARLAVAEEHVWRVEDMERHQVRQLRTHISDLDEKRAQATRVARLSERTRIARDIHDNVGHQLTRAIMQIQAGRVVAQSKGDCEAEQTFAEVARTLDTAMTTIRRSVHDLEDEGTDFTAQISDATQAIGASFDGAAGQLDVELNNGIDTAPAPVTHCLATIIRESLNNTVRHSPARSVHVTLRDLPAFWQLVVQDDGAIQQSLANDQGTGMGRPDVFSGKETGERPLQRADLWRGMGLADIEARAKALGGIAHSGSNQRGWRVFVSLPKEPWADHIRSEDKEAIT